MKRVAGLDALRGLAITAVFVFHVSIVLIFDFDLSSRIAKAGALFGWLGVDLFFVLSGYLITRIALENRAADPFLGPFWARRCLRIVPAYYVLLFVTLVAFPALDWGSAFPEPGERMAAFSYWLFVSNVAMAAVGDHGYRPLSVTWSLAVEMQFYLIWPPIVRVLSVGMLRRTILALLVAMFLGRIVALSVGLDEFAVFVLTPLRGDSLLAGALIACLSAGGRTIQSRPVLWTGAVLCAGLLSGGLLSAVPFVYANPALISLKYSLAAALFYCVVSLAFSARSRDGTRRLTRALSALGGLSYGIYLWHYTIIIVVAEFLLRDDTVRNAWSAFALLLALSAVASVAAAVVSGIAIEKPSLMLKRRFVYGGKKARGRA